MIVVPHNSPPAAGATIGELLTVDDVAGLLKARSKTIRQWVYQGKIPSLKINGLLRFSRHQLDSWIALQAGEGS